MSDEEFLNLVERGMAALGAQVHARLKNVAIVIANRPTKEQCLEGGGVAGSL